MEVCVLDDESLKVSIRQFSEDNRNCSLEFNEFLKMVAHDNKYIPLDKAEELTEAFRFLGVFSILVLA